MKTIKSLLCVVLAVAMLFALAACGGDTTATSSIETSSVADTSSTRSQITFEEKPIIDETVPGLASTDATLKTGVRLDENGNLLFRPEDVGELDNSIITSLITPAPEDEWILHNVTWKEEAYDVEFDYDVCAWADRDAKWVAAYVGGDSYDIITRTNFPTTAVKGLLEPIDLHLPTNDARYFQPTNIWNDHVYGVNVRCQNYNYVDVTEVFGIWYNADLFEENGLTTPLELWENGEWTFDAFIEAAEALTFDTDRDGIDDVFGWGTWCKKMFTVGNGAKTVDIKRDRVELTWNSSEYINGLEYLIKALPFAYKSGASFADGKIAMYIERLSHAKEFSPASSECAVNFTAEWVPTPVGPDGEGYMGLISTGAETQCIGKGAKNIEGALVWICADLIKYEYIDDTNNPAMNGVTDEMMQRALSCEDKMLADLYVYVGNLEQQMYKFWDDVTILGAKAAIEKYTPSFQGEIDILMKEKIQ